MIGIGSMVSGTRNDYECGLLKRNTSMDAASGQAAKVELIHNMEKPQTLTEFKKEIYGTINAMTVHPSQSNTQISISISDKAFEKMMHDEAYQKDMLRVIQRDLNGAYPGNAAPTYSSITIGDDCEYRADAMGSSYGSIFTTHSRKSFWEKNTKKASDSYEEFLNRKKQYSMQQQKIAYQRELDERKIAIQQEEEREFQEEIKSEYRYKRMLEQYEQEFIYL